MSAPYRRIIVMYLAIILGGFAAMLLHTSMPALLLLIALKIAADLHAHRREHKAVNLIGSIPRRLRRKADCKSAAGELGVDTSRLAARFFISV